MRTVLFLFLAGILIESCSVSNQIKKTAQSMILNDAALKTAHLGISIYEPGTRKWWYNYQGEKYFVPASNVKIATCFAAMKYLGDSLVAAKLATDEQERLWVFPSGDPTFLNEEFKHQPLLEKMKSYKTILWSVEEWEDERWGSGWSWNDYDASYMAEKSPLPVYGNVAKFRLVNDRLITVPTSIFCRAGSGIDYNTASRTVSSNTFQVERSLDKNDFFLRKASGKFSSAAIPLRMDTGFVSELLKDTLKAVVTPLNINSGFNYNPVTQIIHSQLTDSLLKPMMHRSDNFFAEQTLLMASSKLLGVMSDEKIIDTILKTDFKDLPQKPRWVDGSGLSRYNLFTPQDFVTILEKMQNAFGMDRIREVLPTGNEGTLATYYKSDTTFLHAKTGTLSGVVALSGYLTTQKGRKLIFSILVNNHQASATQVRRAVEKFLQNLRQNY